MPYVQKVACPVTIVSNRIQEIRRNNFVAQAMVAHTWELTHEIEPGTNQLRNVEREVDEDPDDNDYIESVIYDSMGNITSYRSRKNGTRDYSLEYNDKRFPILPTQIAITDEVTEQFAYDYSGTRIKRVVDEDGQPEDVTYFIPFGTENQAELDAFGRVKRAYIFSGSERIGYKGNGQTVVYVKDYLGSTRMTLALHQPSIPEALLQSVGDNGPYGNTWKESYVNGADGEPHQFTGQEREYQLGLYYMGARFYDPDLGRFLQVDPDRVYWNSYSYVGNNPISFSDPTGRNPLALAATAPIWLPPVIEAVGVGLYATAAYLGIEYLINLDFGPPPSISREYNPELTIPGYDPMITVRGNPGYFDELTLPDLPPLTGDIQFPDMQGKPIPDIAPLIVMTMGWGAYLAKEVPKPADMADAHAHHILYQKGNRAAQQALVAVGQAILIKHGIDPIYGYENLIWAPIRVKGQHHIDTLRPLVEQLKFVDETGGGYEDVVKVLRKHGRDAARRK